MNAGIVALAVNVAVALGVTWLGPRDADVRPDAEVLALDDEFPRDGARSRDGAAGPTASS